MKRYQLIATDSVPIPKIYCMGFSDDPNVTRYGPSVRNQYIIHYVLSGKGILDGKTVTKGQGFLTAPGMLEDYRPDENDPWSYLWVMSDDPAMQYFFDCHNANEETGIFSFHSFYELHAAAEQLRASSNSFASSTQLSELFLNIFHSCVMTNSIRQASITKMYFEFSVNYVKTNLHMPISVKDLCSAIGITQPYLYRIFQQAAGCSPKQYISNCKLTEAKRLLAKTDISISQIADSLGFHNVLDFSKFFSKQTNVSPTIYRNTYR